MSGRCLLYYITDRLAFAGDESAHRRCLLGKIAEAARCGVDYVQLREKDMPARELGILARAAVATIREARKSPTALLINSRTDVALATEADGVHLRSDDVSPLEVRAVWRQSSIAHSSRAPNHEISRRDPVIAVSCHSAAEVAEASAGGANFAVFGPVFEKKDSPGLRPAGLTTLVETCYIKIPVLALGGVTIENAKACLEAGAAGIAGIRLFQENDIAEVVRELR